MDGRARAGPGGEADSPTVRATPSAARRSGPPTDEEDPATDDGRSGSHGVNGTGANGTGANGTNGIGTNGTGVNGTNGVSDTNGNGPITGPGTGTLRRSRAPRPDGGEPTLRVPPEGSQPVGDPSRLGPVADGSQPVRRPVPPTFPSPGQPPPGVARRDGRHARPEARSEQHHTPPNGYRPRHAAPDAETEQFPVVNGHPLPPAAEAPAALSGPSRHGMSDVDLAEAPGDADLGDPFHESSDRVRIVLAERRSPTRAVRTVAEIEAQTETGELLLGNLLRAQLTLAIRLGLVALLLLGALPVLFLVLPALGSVDLFGIRVPWLLVGVAPYPFLVLLGWLHIRTAERNELDFADNVED